MNETVGKTLTHCTCNLDLFRDWWHNVQLLHNLHNRLDFRSSSRSLGLCNHRCSSMLT